MELRFLCPKIVYVDGIGGAVSADTGPGKASWVIQVALDAWFWKFLVNFEETVFVRADDSAPEPGQR